jgi:lipopolysaccharide export system permease protein
MKLIDRYIVRQFVSHFFFALLAIIMIFIIIDLMENVDDFIDRGAPVGIVIVYYIYFIPEMVKSMIPVAMLLSSLFTTGKLSNQNELVAMKAGGISLYRFLLPFISIGIIVTCASIYFNGWIVPLANKEKYQIERQHLAKSGGMDIVRYNIYIQDSPVRFLSLGYFDESTNAVSRVSIQEFSDTNFAVMIRRFDAPRMEWKADEHRWILYNTTVREFSDTRERLTTFDELPMEYLRFNPDDIARKQLQPDEMTYFELAEFIQSQRRAGQQTARWEVDYYAKIAFPFASLIVILFGVPFSAQKRRGGLALQFAIGVLITFLYMAFMAISETLGQSGQYNTMLMAWLPNLIFLNAGLFNLLRVRK